MNQNLIPETRSPIEAYVCGSQPGDSRTDDSDKYSAISVTSLSILTA